jgi:hypothetical protein
MKILLNTNICPLLDVGLYESALSEAIDPYDENGNYLEVDEYDMKGYKDHIKPIIKNCLTNIIDGCVNSTLAAEDKIKFIDVDNYYSPRFYNYESDTIDFTIQIKLSTIKTLSERCLNDSNFISFLEEFNSRDGFISFTPCNKSEFLASLKNDRSRAVALILWFLCKESMLEYQMDFEEQVLSNTWAFDFVTLTSESQSIYDKEV